MTIAPITVCYTITGFPQKDIDAIAELLPGVELIFGLTPADFSEVKNSGKDLAVIMFGAQSHDILKDLCDDYANEKRRVKFIYSLSAGVDAYRLLELKQEVEGIPIHNGQSLYSNILAEHVNFAMMYFNRFSWRLNEAKHQKKFEKFNMIPVEGKKVLIYGYGDIGSQCGRLAVGLGMDVTGVRRTVKDPVDQYGVKVVSDGDALLGEADFVVGVLPGTEATKQFFNMSLFKRMKPSAVFINIGRGSTQCETDIAEALNTGVIRAAALDVFEVEPLPESSPLWDLPDDKMLLSPHCADFTEDMLKAPVLRFKSIFNDYSTTGRTDAYRVSVEKGY
ncbi:d-isomer specific 2-hydroxyacid dehydrogenase-like protein [Angomonas deanei]|nr:d-isomer specific 2-hydroxyacid dehydrogenase-like protein [Angomonas deanei]|eukprot:EPY39103.1 d-isomer specific 2-hydroxyacid dehydrogenase-like protein [Angomonas deanei]